MSKQKIKYLDDRGREHDSEEAASKSDEMRKAVEAFESAQRLVSSAFGKGAKTGDGRPFSEISSGHFYHVKRFAGGRPWIREVWVWPHDAVLYPENGQIVFRNVNRDIANGRVEIVEFSISDLYINRRNAQSRYLELLLEYQSEISEEIAELQKKLGVE